MSTATSYPIRLEKKIIERIRPLAAKARRTLKAQIEFMLSAVMAGDGR